MALVPIREIKLLVGIAGAFYGKKACEHKLIRLLHT